MSKPLKGVAPMVTWLQSTNHILALAAFFMLYQIVRGVAHICDALDGLREDYRRVNDLDMREEMEMQSKI
jgi:hypothetical protein